MDVQSAMVKAPQFHLSDLREYTEYTFWVSAFNDNGEGALSEEVRGKNFILIKLT